MSGVLRDLLQGAGLLEQMRRARHDDQLIDAPNSPTTRCVQPEDLALEIEQQRPYALLEGLLEAG